MIQKLIVYSHNNKYHSVYYCNALCYKILVLFSAAYVDRWFVGMPTQEHATYNYPSDIYQFLKIDVTNT